MIYPVASLSSAVRNSGNCLLRSSIFQHLTDLERQVPVDGGRSWNLKGGSVPRQTRAHNWLHPTTAVHDTWGLCRLSRRELRSQLPIGMGIGMGIGGGKEAGGGSFVPRRQPFYSRIAENRGRVTRSNGRASSFEGSEDLKSRTTQNGYCSGDSGDISDKELEYMLRTVKLADSSAGLTAPHPKWGCTIVEGQEIVGEGYLFAQGTVSAEVQAVSQAKERSHGATAYLNLESGDCHGDTAAVSALIKAGLARVVIGLRHPLSHFRSRAIAALKESGIRVDVLAEDTRGENTEEAVRACRGVNIHLLYRAAHRVPFSILKWAMTLDGKLATNQGHATWISSEISRGRVHSLRCRSDAIIVGGNTVRRDNPRLTTRQEGGHFPARIVMSTSLRLPETANLWDVTRASTIVLTQKGARKDFQALLRSKGVEVVEFDFLTPAAAMEYCYQRGFLQVLWECGGTLSAPAIRNGVIHKIWAIVAPKIIGGVGAPTPVGDLGFVEMTQALTLEDVEFEQIGPDMLVTGYLKGLPDPRSKPGFLRSASGEALGGDGTAFAGLDNEPVVISFFKQWDPYGAFSNFSAHPIVVSDEQTGHDIHWKSVEHYYQASKFHSSEDPVAVESVEAIRSAASPEEAARIGRRLERQRPDLITPEWSVRKLDVMYEALRCKFTTHAMPRALLMSTMGLTLLEASPYDSFWGAGQDGCGCNHLGRLLMRLRSELRLKEVESAAAHSSESGQPHALA